MKMIDRIVLIILSLLAVTSNDLLAQPEQASFTFSPNSFERTKSFMLTEFGVGKRFDDYKIANKTRSESDTVFTWELGYMRNVSKRWAIGFSGFLNSDDWRSQFGVKPRVRYWLGRQSSIDLAAGPILKTFGEDDLTHTGVSSHLGVNPTNWIGIDFGFEYVSFDGTIFAPGGESRIPVDGTRVSYSISTKLSGLSGSIVGTAGPAIVALVLYLILHNDSDF